MEEVLHQGRSTLLLLKGKKKNGFECVSDGFNKAVDIGGIVGSNLGSLKFRVGVDQQGEDREPLVPIAPRYVVKLSELLTRQVGEIRAGVPSEAAFEIVWGAWRIFGPGRGGSIGILKYTASVNIKWLSVGEESVGTEHQEYTFLDNEGVFPQLGET